MLVLLPPSEGKSAPTDGRPLDLDDLVAPELTEHRRTVLRALTEVSARPDAADVLGTGPSLAGEVARNTRLASAPAAPARHVYTGVLHTAAALGSLDGAAATRARRAVRTVSALWGLVAPDDRIPAYRLSMGTDLPGVGPLAASWRRRLATVLDPMARERLVVDCRSAAYAAAWRAPADARGAVEVRVVRERDGRRSVVSHGAKHTRGVLTRHLLTRGGADPTTPSDLLEASREMVGTGLIGTELSHGSRGRHVLTLVVG